MRVNLVHQHHKKLQRLHSPPFFQINLHPTMPTYLLHGFRWHRQSIRIHVILNDLEDAAPEWLLAPATSVSILNSLYTLYDFLPPSNPPPLAYAHMPNPPKPTEEDKQTEDTPRRPKLKKNKFPISISCRSMNGKTRPADLANTVNGNGHGHTDREGSTSGSDNISSTKSGSMYRSSSKPGNKPRFNEWSVVKLMEQYDPNDVKVVSQPYAYVADYMVEVSLGVAITEEMAKYETKITMEDSPLSPLTPGTPGTPGATGGLGSPQTNLSMRDVRRKERRLGWFEKLRDGLQAGEEIGWHVVVCGDEERAFPYMEITPERLDDDDIEQLRTPRSAGFRGLFKLRNIYEE
jgi:hypothetical protein